MNLSRFINCGCVFFKNLHQASAVHSVFALKTLRMTPTVHFSSFYNSEKFLDSNKLALTSFNYLMFSSRGLKVRAQLHLRCKDCYFVRKDGIMYVECSSYPRHKQRAMTKRPKYSWILTYAFQSKYRPY